MKTLFVGDLHAKQKIILPFVQDVAMKHHVNQIVFMGDYVDEFTLNSEDCVEALQFHIDWVSKLPDYVNVIHIIGNHDACYIDTKTRNTASGHNYDKEDEIHDLLSKLPNLVPSHHVGKYLITHGGVTQNWLNDVKYDMDVNPEELSKFINTLYCEKGVDVLNTCGPYREGYDPCSGPFWTDVRELVEFGVSVNQIVAHTPVDAIRTYRRADGTLVTDVDTFSCNIYGYPKSSASILLYDSDSDKKHNVPFCSEAGSSYKEACRPLYEKFELDMYSMLSEGV